MKSVIAAIAGVCLLLAPAKAVLSAEVTTHTGTVVELFTSQGCNSCPPADALLGELAKRDDLIALTFNVDYWDYLGWRDTLASPAHSERQRAYAEAMHERRVYTPQTVIGGRLHAVGSDRRDIEQAIRQVQRLADGNLHIGLSSEGDKVLVRLPDGPRPVEAKIWLVRYDRVQEVAIRRGENGGRTLKYYNVVRELTNIGLWRGEAMEIAYMQEDMTKGGRDGCAVIVQQDGHGPVLGAAAMDFAPRS